MNTGTSSQKFFTNELHELREFRVFGTLPAHQKPFCFVKDFSCNSLANLMPVVAGAQSPE